MKTNINLHIHSNQSDGEYSVDQIVNSLKNHGVEYFSITDHDEVIANQIAFDLAIKRGLKYVPGIELTCNFHGELGFFDLYSMHIVGLGIDSGIMKQLLSKNQVIQSQRLLELFNILKYGDYSRIQLGNIINGEGLILRRTIIAKELVRQGYFKSTSDVFKLLLDKSEFASYVNKRFSISEGIKAIHYCGGKAIWAHPFFIRKGHKHTLTVDQIVDLLPILMGYGLDGIETYYLGFDLNQVSVLHKLALSNGLLESIATDYHGEHGTLEGKWESEIVYAPNDINDINCSIIDVLMWNKT